MLLAPGDSVISVPAAVRELNPKHWTRRRRQIALEHSALHLETAQRDRARAEALLAGQQRILRLLAEGRELSRVLEALCRTAEGVLDSVRCGVMLLEPDGQRLQLAAGPSLPPEYRRAVDGLTVGPDVLTCGAAVVNNRRIVAVSVQDDPVWASYGQWAVDVAIHASWSQPMNSSTGEVVGTFEMYPSESRPPSPHEIRVMEMAADLAGVAVDRRRSDEALRKALESAEAANRAKGQFLAHMSHEIRTPLNAVIGMSGLLLDSELDEQQHECVDTIRTSGEALLGVLNDILDYSKIEAGRLELERTQFEIRRCIEESLDLVAAAAVEKGIELVSVVQRDVPTYVFGDPTRLRQVLVNLLSNAVKFTGDGEVVVTVSASRLDDEGVEPAAIGVSRPARSRAHRLRIEVQDTGIGIPSDRLESLFQPFHQVDASTTRRFGGTGLGLAITRRLVDLMGGSLAVDSVLGTGSTFTVELVLPASATRPRRGLGDRRLAGRSALIVDDNASSLASLQLQLEDRGLTVSTALGIADWAPAQLARFDVLLLDLDAPGVDMDILVALEGVVGAPAVVLLSPIGVRVEVPRSLYAAALRKPPKAGSLRESVAAALAGGRYESSDPDELQLMARLAQNRPLRILIAEDNVVNQRVAVRILERMGYRADVVANGVEVMGAMRRANYDVVLMDVQMPEMDGLSATRLIRRHYPTSMVSPYIIAMTANALEGDRERCLEAGMNDYIGKPVRVAELHSALMRVPIARADRQ